MAACGGEDLECGDGTVDQNGQGVPAEEVEDICAEGTTVEDGRCVPTDQVCDEGTTFDADTRLCLPDATCQEGDVIVDGVCVSPAQELAGQADIEETENNDPATGGEAQDLGLADADGEVVFTGAIDAPADLDGDDSDDQDVDVFSFAHRLYDPSGARLTDTGFLPSMNLPTPAEYASHYEPNGGRFLLRVVAGNDLPDTRVKAMVSEPTDLGSPSQDNPVTTEPTAYTNNQARYFSVDVTDGQMFSLQHDNLNTRPMELYVRDAATGELVHEDSSFWPQSNNSADTARLRAPQDGTYIVKMVSQGETMDEDVLTLESFTPDIDLGTVDADNAVTHSVPNDLMEDEVITATFDTVAGQKVTVAHDNAEAEEMGVIVRGPDGSELTSSPIVLNEDAFAYYSFEIPDGYGVRISHDNDQENDTDFILYGSDGSMLLEADAPATSAGGLFGWEPEDYINSMRDGGGMHYLSAENGDFSNSTTQTITLEAVEPIDLGTVSDGELVHTNDGTYEEGEIVFYQVTFDEPVIFSGGMYDENDDLTLHDSEGQELASEYSGEFEDYSVPAGTYYFGYEVGGEYDSHTLEFTLRPGFTLP
ncbi:MAG: hypothetical protein ACLFVJ_07205 [Persicimonas sp.]